MPAQAAWVAAKSRGRDSQVTGEANVENLTLRADKFLQARKKIARPRAEAKEAQARKQADKSPDSYLSCIGCLCWFGPVLVQAQVPAQHKCQLLPQWRRCWWQGGCIQWVLVDCPEGRRKDLHA